MNLTVFALIIINVIFNTVAQISLKNGISQIGVFSFTWNNLLPITNKIIISPWIIFGMLTYVGSITIWLMVLSRIPVSMAYPMASLGYITSSVAAYYLFGENLTLTKIAGIAVIMLGVYLVAKN